MGSMKVVLKMTELIQQVPQRLLKQKSRKFIGLSKFWPRGARWPTVRVEIDS